MEQRTKVVPVLLLRTVKKHRREDGTVQAEAGTAYEEERTTRGIKARQPAT